MKRAQLYLGGLLVLQIALILLFRSPFAGAATEHESRPLWPELEALTPSVVEILDKDDASITIVRSGDDWTVQSLDGFPADTAKIEELLGNLQDLRVRRPVVSSGRYHQAFKVAEDEHEARIRLWADAGTEPDVDLLLGSAPNFRTVHVRRGGDDAVYEARGLSAYELRPAASGWIARELVEIDETQVVGLKLTNASGSFELRKQDRNWQLGAEEDPEAPALDQGRVDDFVRRVSSLRLDDAVGSIDEAAHGFVTPAATLVIRYAAGAVPEGAQPDLREVTVRVGAEAIDDESRRYVTRDGFAFTGTIWESSVNRLLEGTPDEFVAS